MLNNDNNGNMIQKTDGSNYWQWGYDWQDRMITYTDYTDSVAYSYDVLNRRISKDINSGTTVEQYFYDGANVVADYDGDDVLLATYLTPFLDENLLTVQGENIYYFMQDGLGSVRNIIDSYQSVQNTYDYNGFGEALSQTENVTNRYRFTGREWDNETQTYHYRARQYNPASGRFTCRDPISYLGGLNIYAYCGNNPVNYTDPFGLEGGWLRTAWDGWARKLTPNPKPPEPPKTNPDTPKAEDPKPKTEDPKPKVEDPKPVPGQTEEESNRKNREGYNRPDNWNESVTIPMQSALDECAPSQPAGIDMSGAEERRRQEELDRNNGK